MFTLYPYQELGSADHGWLNARHHFSFASYRNPKRTGFGNLLVINDDIILGQSGFATHPHDNMEIITYVRKGAITHKDSMGNVGKTSAGDVQVMSAGSGVRHSEYNLEQQETKLYQIWIRPNKFNVEPRWEAKEFPKEAIAEQLSLLVSGDIADKESGALFIYQDAKIYGGKIKQGTTIKQPIKDKAYILASLGSLEINNNKMHEGDGAEIVDENLLTINTVTDAEILVIVV